MKKVIHILSLDSISWKKFVSPIHLKEFLTGDSGDEKGSCLIKAKPSVICALIHWSHIEFMCVISVIAEFADPNSTTSNEYE